MKVRKWTIPLTFVGLGGLGAMLFSERGRRLLRSVSARFSAAPGRLAAWNDSAQKELDHIRQEIDALEHSLGTHTAR